MSLKFWKKLYTIQPHFEKHGSYKKERVYHQKFQCDNIAKVWTKTHTLFFFYKNHVFQNEAGLFLIFFKNRGSIVLNLFLNLTKSFRKKEKKQELTTITFSFLKLFFSGLNSSIDPFFIHFLYFLLYLSSFFFFKFEAHCS